MHFTQAESDPVDPFIDRDGYFRHIDNWEAKFREMLADQQRRSSRWGAHWPAPRAAWAGSGSLGWQ